MKKYLKYIFTVIIMTSILPSCEDYLNIKPPNNLSEAQYYKTQEHAIQATTACYDPLKHPGAFNINFFFVFTSFSDRGIHEQAALNKLSFTANTNWVIQIYTYLYKGIARCNVALEKIPDIQMDEDLKARLLGEVRYLRALYNFYIVTIYGTAPVIDHVINDLDVKFHNSTREDFLNIIESDLKQAIDVLPLTYDDANVGRATRGAAMALLGKTYLYYQMWPEAKDYPQQVKDLADNQGVYGLMMPQGDAPKDYIYAYQCNFSAIDLTTPSGNTYDSENNKESIFEIQFAEGGWEVWEGGWQADGSLTDLYFGPDGYKNLVPTADFVNAFEKAPASHPAGLEYDPRRYATIYEEGDTIHYLPSIDPPMAPVPWHSNKNTNPSISQGYGWQKYFDPCYNTNNGPTNLKIMRYSDVLLMLAEADYHVNGSTQLGLDCINEVRNRVGLTPVTQVTPQAIIHERDVEFGFEWMRFFDLVRWSLLDAPWVTITDFIPDFIVGKNEILPLPQYEINLSGGNLLQNPGY
ncbi:MAG TPA: RagB/SusD family nutrient uptake outer membrane protein [Bacteroidales bacterium]|nr:RagB/SusD family nutrient uptake outer membrane protein [Bacteroidales bacterium]